MGCGSVIDRILLSYVFGIDWSVRFALSNTHSQSERLSLPQDLGYS